MLILTQLRNNDLITTTTQMIFAEITIYSVYDSVISFSFDCQSTEIGKHIIENNYIMNSAVQYSLTHRGINVLNVNDSVCTSSHKSVSLPRNRTNVSLFRVWIWFTSA